ncbi:hypothetical protein T09_1470 [Trichinella sp. T9]|nr:hypothetical protein T09_1470 [Trichinella sp. T9]
MLCPSANVPFWEDAKKPLCKGNLIRPVNGSNTDCSSSRLIRPRDFLSGSLLIVMTTASKQISVHTNLLPSAITTIRYKQFYSTISKQQ